MNKAIYRSAVFRSSVTAIVIGIVIVKTVKKYTKIK